MSQKTLVNGTEYTITLGRTNIDGTGYNIFQGRTIDEVGYNIFLKNRIRNYAEGEIVYIKEWKDAKVDTSTGATYGKITLTLPVLVPFYVAKHNYEEELNGSGRTLLVRTKCVKLHSSGSQRNYGIGVYLNANSLEFPARYGWHIDPSTLELMGSTTYRFAADPSYGNENYTVKTASHPIFAPSLYEYGFNDPNTLVDGVELPIADKIKIGIDDNGEPVIQAIGSSSKYPYDLPYIMEDGTIKRYETLPYNSVYVRPCFTVSEDAEVDKITDEIIADNNQSTISYYFTE